MGPVPRSCRCVTRERRSPARVASGLVLIATALGARSMAAEPGPSADTYTRSLKPLLASRCFPCHGGLRQQAGLRLDTVALMEQGGESGGVIRKGRPDESPMLARVSDPDPLARMPPEGEGEPLSPEQLAMLRDWIAAGCPAPPDERPEPDPRDHWAFRPRTTPAVPAIAAASGVCNPIDAFLGEARAEAGVTARPEAPRAVLVRRLFIDLIGLPPLPEDLEAAESDPAADWYERLVDRLLGDPRHGERWARHWMDIWRYSDWWGLGNEHRYSQKHMWHFRDWIVESLNADVPYDEMVRQMLAADEYFPEEPAKLRATGFLARNWFLFNRTPWMDETVEHVGKGLLGLTLNCAKCHDHKYDPISQEDYYRFRSFFEPIETRLDVVEGEGDLEQDGIPRVFDGHLERPTHLFLRGEDTQPDTTRPLVPGIPEALSFGALEVKPVSLPRTVSDPVRRPWVIDAHLSTARRAVESADAALAKALEQERIAGIAIAAEEKPDGPAAPPGSAPAIESARALLMAAERERHTAEAAAAVARATLESVIRRAEATRLALATDAVSTADARSDGTVPPVARAAAQAAARAERQVVVARARQKVVALEGRLAVASDDKKPAIDKELPAARDAVIAAEQAVEGAGEMFSPLVGAKWTPTRFNSSGKDDPAVAFPETSTGRRTALAEWIVDPRNPLTARVAANHLWNRHMGRPLVATVFDLGRKGQAPTQPRLLDWLAGELVEGPREHGTGERRGWSLKHLHRLICTSAAYRMQSSIAGGEVAMTLDPDNELLWRREPIRLEAQVVRDSILFLAGTLDPTRGGPPVAEADQPGSRRRSLYFWHSDISRNAFLTTFDDAAVTECYERDRSIVPQQALALSNAAIVHDASAAIATRLQAGVASMDDQGFLERAFRMILHRAPGSAERSACGAAMASWRDLPGDGRTGAGASEPARVLLVWALLNHNDFLTLR